MQSEYIKTHKKEIMFVGRNALNSFSSLRTQIIYLIVIKSSKWYPYNTNVEYDIWCLHIKQIVEYTICFCVTR